MVFWFGLMLYAPVNSYCHVWMVSSLNHTFFLGKLDEAFNPYYMHILSLVTDNNPSWMSGREENGRRNYLMINLHVSMGLGRDQTRNPWICSQTRYWLRYLARQYVISETSIFSLGHNYFCASCFVKFLLFRKNTIHFFYSKTRIVRESDYSPNSAIFMLFQGLVSIKISTNINHGP